MSYWRFAAIVGIARRVCAQAAQTSYTQRRGVLKRVVGLDGEADECYVLAVVVQRADVHYELGAQPACVPCAVGGCAPSEDGVVERWKDGHVTIVRALDPARSSLNVPCARASRAVSVSQCLGAR